MTATEVEYPYRLLLSILRPAFGTFIPESQAVIVLPEVTLERAKVEVCAVTVFAFMAPNAAGTSNAGASNAGTRRRVIDERRKIIDERRRITERRTRRSYGSCRNAGESQDDVCWRHRSHGRRWYRR